MWGDTALVLLLAALPGLVAWAAFGVYEAPDTAGYLAYAERILHQTVPAGQDLLQEGPAPITLFRVPGYPAFLAALQWAFLCQWRGGAVLVQIAASALVAAAAFRTTLNLGARRGLAFAAALMPAVGFGVTMQNALLTDSLTATFYTGAALCLAGGAGVARGVIAGVLLALATTFREATPFLMIALLPLAWRWQRMLATIAPPLFVVAALVAWNDARIGYPVLTTTQQTNMVQALFPEVQQGLPVYPRDDAFDRLARETLDGQNVDRITLLQQRLFEDEHMTAPEMASAATSRFLHAWTRFPVAMLVGTAQRWKGKYLEMPFAPVDALADLVTYSGGQTDITKVNVLWRRTLGGDAVALGWLVLLSTTRALGIAVALVGIVCPWLPGRGWPARGLWFACTGVLLYLPVHVESRYLLPAVSLLCAAAALSVSPARRVGALPRLPETQRSA
jgi:hypothetical protein